MAEDNLRRLLDYLLEEAKQRGPRHVVGGKMTIPNSLEMDSPGIRIQRRYPTHQLTGSDLAEWRV